MHPQFAVHVGYNLHLEQSVLFDICATPTLPEYPALFPQLIHLLLILLLITDLLVAG